MDALNFCYWLQGFSELTVDPPTEAQWEMIKEHLGTVFTKITKPLIPNKEPIAPWFPKGPGTTGPLPMTLYPSIPVVPMTPGDNKWPEFPYIGDGKPIEIIC